MRLDHLLSKERTRPADAKSQVRFRGESLDRCLILKAPGGDFKAGIAGGEAGEPGRRGCSSDGRAPALQAGGRQFESVHLHQLHWRRDAGNVNRRRGREDAEGPRVQNGKGRAAGRPADARAAEDDMGS